MKLALRLLRWFVTVCLCLLLFLALFYGAEDWRGRRAWAAARQELASGGEQLDWAHFIPPPVPDDQNLALAPFFVRELGCYSDPSTGHLSISPSRPYHLTRRITSLACPMGTTRVHPGDRGCPYGCRAPFRSTGFPCKSNVAHSFGFRSTTCPAILRMMCSWVSPATLPRWRNLPEPLLPDFGGADRRASSCRSRARCASWPAPLPGSRGQPEVQWPSCLYREHLPPPQCGVAGASGTCLGIPGVGRPSGGFARGGSFVRLRVRRAWGAGQQPGHRGLPLRPRQP